MEHSQDQIKRLAKSSPKEALENSFISHWMLLFPKLPAPVRQHPIRNPASGRDWRLDFAWVPEMLAVEIQGGSWVKGGHNTALGQAKDYTRHNHLTRIGWRTLFFNTPMCQDMAEVVTEVAEVLCSAK